ncbi:MAG: TlpA disulfide reductase family protein [Lachnospiraceae bacterium]
MKKKKMWVLFPMVLTMAVLLFGCSSTSENAENDADEERTEAAEWTEEDDAYLDAMLEEAMQEFDGEDSSGDAAVSSNESVEEETDRVNDSNADDAIGSAKETASEEPAEDASSQTTVPEDVQPADAPVTTPTPTPEPAPTPAPVSIEGYKFEFSTTDRAGNVLNESIFSNYKVTMINFFEPWCGPCVGEMPDLNELYQTYKDQGFQILGVYSTEDGIEDVLAYTGVTYPILHYSNDFGIFRTGYVPTTVFVDSEGHVLRIDYNAKTVQGVSEGELDSDLENISFIGAYDYYSWELFILTALQAL